MCYQLEKRDSFRLSLFSQVQSYTKQKACYVSVTGFCGASKQIRTADLILTKDALYRLSYRCKGYCINVMGKGKVVLPLAASSLATPMGLEPTISGVTGRRDNRLRYGATELKKSGRGRRIRTLGTRFWRPLLYQLSYTPMWWAFTDSNRGPTGYEPVALTN